MNTNFSAFGLIHHQGESATHPLTRLAVRLPLSLLLAGPCLRRRRFVAATPQDAPSGASNCGF